MIEHINLARKLRPKNFSEVIGQDISVKMLCNGLALQKLFPTYIFSGGRGCGKTTTARIFAAALNCQNLTQILAQKSLNIPCNACQSCAAMLAGNHSDFIEIDAASNTGVDNVRQVLETATYLPLVGSKKIYLIDEAHMLSKSAFNALLKMLEEPPRSAIFMLATTELNKIPDTVRSRCFQAFFKPVAATDVLNYLQAVCPNENLNLNPAVLKIISTRCDGSLRDALNMLEQISWACLNEPATKQESITTTMLGLATHEDVVALGQFVLEGNSKQLLAKMASIDFSHKKPELLWQDFATFLTEALKIKLGAVIDQSKILYNFVNSIELAIIKKLAIIFWQQESIFLRTVQKSLFLEHFLLQLSSMAQISADNPRPTAAEETPAVTTSKQTPLPQKATTQISKEFIVPQQLPAAWLNFLESPELLTDKLLESILKQVVKIEILENHATLFIVGLNGFFQRKLDECHALIIALLRMHFSGLIDFSVATIAATKAPATIKTTQASIASNKEVLPERLPILQAKTFDKPDKNAAFDKKTVTIDVSDETLWPKSNLLTKLFGGKVEGVQ